MNMPANFFDTKKDPNSGEPQTPNLQVRKEEEKLRQMRQDLEDFEKQYNAKRERFEEADDQLQEVWRAIDNTSEPQPVASPVVAPKPLPVEISDPVEQMRVAYAKDRGIKNAVPDTGTITSPKIENLRLEDFKKRRLLMINLLEKERVGSNDRETISLLEMQLEEIEKHIALEEKQEMKQGTAPAPLDTVQNTQETEKSQTQTPDIATLDSNPGFDNQDVKPGNDLEDEDDQSEPDLDTYLKPIILDDTPNNAPGQRTLDKLHEMGISYEDITQIVPDFASMSEGKQAYILYKAQENSIDVIHERGQERFEEDKKSVGWFDRTFRKGTLKREALRSVANEYRGIDSFKDDISELTNRVKENGNEIVIEPEGNYRIEYVEVPKELDPKDPFRLRCENFNRAATAFSDVPYEWGLPTATSRQKKEYKRAENEFKNHENNIADFLHREAEKEGKNIDGYILRDKFLVQFAVQKDQLLSSYKDAGRGELETMKTATWKSQFTKAVSEAFSKDNLADNAGKLGILGSGVAARMFTKAMWGMGAATGVSAVIGGVLGVRKKNEQFRKNAIDARRGGALKDTTDKVFDAKSNTDRIYKLLAQFEKSPGYNRQNRTLQALEDRIQLLDERLKAGRVNFGKPKDQLKNKSELITVMTHALIYKQQAGKVSDRVDQFLTRKDKKTRNNRRLERIDGALAGATLGAFTSIAVWKITDYFSPNIALDKINSIIEKINAGIPPSDITPSLPDASTFPGMGAGKEGWDAINEINNPTNLEAGAGGISFDVSVEASPRGHIQTVIDLREKINNLYPDLTKAPVGIQEFMEQSKNPTQYSIDKGLFIPGQTDESGVSMKGDQFGINKQGEQIYSGSRTGVDNLSQGKFDKEYFDFASMGNESTADVPQQTAPVETNLKSAATSENFFADESSSKPEVQEVSTATNETPQPKINNTPIQYTLETNSNGVPFMQFEKSTLDGMSPFQKSYLAPGVSLESYAQNIANSPEFQKINTQGISPEKILQDMKNTLNGFILRDQMIQTGNFSPMSEEYKVLDSERKIFLKELSKFEKFGTKILVPNWDSVKHVVTP